MRLSPKNLHPMWTSQGDIRNNIKFKKFYYMGQIPRKMKLTKQTQGVGENPNKLYRFIKLKSCKTFQKKLLPKCLELFQHLRKK